MRLVEIACDIETCESKEEGVSFVIALAVIVSRRLGRCGILLV